MKRIKKMLVILLLIIVLINNVVLAVIEPNEYKPGSITMDESSRVVNIAEKILGTVRNIGIIISVIIMSIIGLKYILCSLEEKANYKENMMPYIVGCILLASATTIPGLIYDVLNN